MEKNYDINIVLFVLNFFNTIEILNTSTIHYVYLFIVHFIAHMNFFLTE